jgi:hypothetical protein
MNLEVAKRFSTAKAKRLVDTSNKKGSIALF